MKLNITPGNLSDDQEFKDFRATIESRTNEGQLFEIDLESTSDMNLSRFNSLVMLYVSLKRAGKDLKYTNFGLATQNFVDKTNFHHVFAK